MATLPTRILEIEFDAGVWTNVTADMVDVTSRRGRNRESGAFETGHFAFKLRNDARKYDPENTAGPYYGKLRPNRRCRLRATYSAVTYPVWLGYIDRISQVAGGPNDAAAVFDASDFFKLLNRAELPVSAYAAEVADDVPTSWWRLDEPAGSSTVIDQVAGRAGTVVGAPGLGDATLVVRDPGAAATFTTTADQVVLPAGSLPTTSSWTIEFLFRGDPNKNNQVLVNPSLNAAGQPVIQTTGAGVGDLSIALWSGGPSAGTGTFKVADNTIHHVAIVGASGTTLKVWVDGVDRTWSPSGNTVPLAADPIVMNGLSSEAGFTIDEVAFYPAALSSARIAAHNSVARTPWNGDDPGTRLQRIAELVATTGSYVLDAGEPTLQSTDLGGTVLAYAQKVEETTGGLLFVDREGDVTFVGRNSSVTGAYLTSKATLVDDDSGAGIPFRSGDADVDEGVLVTRATVSRGGSVAVTFFDAAARDEFGWLDEVHEGLLHNSDAYSLSYAQWIVNTHKAPSTRVGTVALELTRDPAAMYPAILALELGDRVTFKRKPQNVGAVYSADMRVEAITHETGAHYWRTRLQLSPFNLAAGLPVGVWDVTDWDESVWGI